MGHERLGILPKTKKWNAIVEQISNFENNTIQSKEIIESTLSNIQNQLSKLLNDKSIVESFKLLVLLSYSFHSEEYKNQVFETYNINISNNINLTDLSKILNGYLEDKYISLEYHNFAKNALLNSIFQWYNDNNIKNYSLFEDNEQNDIVWKNAGKGSGFCELSRLYFSNLTENYLNYFLERAASANIENISIREKFNFEIKKHIEEISKYAFESSKITQSFAAGWFNKNIKKAIPSTQSIKSFLDYALKKMREEFRREKSNL